MMAFTLRALGRLRGRSVHELHLRTSQVIAAAAERRGLSAQSRLPSDRTFYDGLIDVGRAAGVRDAEALLAHFRGRTTPRFFPGFDDQAATVASLRERWPCEMKRVVETADRICTGHFDLLGRSNLSFGDGIDWHLDPVAGLRAPLLHWSRVPFLDAAVVGDHKLIWEVNRHQYFATLGQAYWYTGDERYAYCFARHLESWMDANPPKRGINWASSLEVAFRAISWTWALHFFLDSPCLTPPLFARTLKFLWLHGRHVETYLSTYFSPNTHLTGEALGLFYLGTLFPELKDAGRWRKRGQRILVEQLDVHVLPDGVYCEQATYYQRYTADFYLHLLTLSRANGAELPSVVTRKLEALLTHLMYLTRPDGTTPLIGDDDGGGLVQFGDRAVNDFRAALAIGASLLSRADYRYVAREPAEEMLWTLGPAGLRAWDSLVPAAPSQMSIAFPDGGYYVMRDGWDAASNILVVDCGPHGFLNGGHAHADALAIDATVDGHTLLVDPGTYTYTADAELRAHFRSSLAHNTATIDGVPQSVPGTAFQWATSARAEPREWVTCDRFDFFEGRHDGYTRLPDSVVHARAIFFLKCGYWVVRDRVQAGGQHDVEIRYQFAPGTRLDSAAHGRAAVARDAAGKELLRLMIFEGDTLRIGEGCVSPGYGRLERAPWCITHKCCTGTQDVVSLLLPPSAAVRETVAVECSSGRALSLTSDEWTDRLLLCGHADEEPAGGGVSARAEWAWIRRSRRFDDILEFIIVRGTRLSSDGILLLAAESPVRFASVRREGDVLQVEIETTAHVVISALGARLAVVNGVPHSLDDAGCLVLSGTPAGLRVASDQLALVI